MNYVLAPVPPRSCEVVYFTILHLLLHSTHNTTSHYKVFAVPVKKDEKEPESVPYSPTVPLDQLPSHAVSSHLVSEVSDPIPFIIGQYSAHTLPEKLTFDGTWMRKAFKPETYYSIVVAAFTKTSVSICSVLLKHMCHIFHQLEIKGMIVCFLCTARCLYPSVDSLGYGLTMYMDINDKIF